MAMLIKYAYIYALTVTVLKYSILPFGLKFKSSHEMSWHAQFCLLGILGEVATGRISASTASGNISVETFDWLKSLNLNNKE